MVRFATGEAFGAVGEDLDEDVEDFPRLTPSKTCRESRDACPMLSAIRGRWTPSGSWVRLSQVFLMSWRNRLGVAPCVQAQAGDRWMQLTQVPSTI